MSEQSMSRFVRPDRRPTAPERFTGDPRAGRGYTEWDTDRRIRLRSEAVVSEWLRALGGRRA